MPVANEALFAVVADRCIVIVSDAPPVSCSVAVLPLKVSAPPFVVLTVLPKVTAVGSVGLESNELILLTEMVGVPT